MTAAVRGAVLDSLAGELGSLDRLLPPRRMVEIDEAARACSPNREGEFRPAFERLFGERMAAFPAPLPPEQYEGAMYPYAVPDPDGGGAIPF